MPSSGFQETFDAIVQLTDEIARASPESADKAMRIAELLRGLDQGEPDRSSIQDAIDAQAVGDLSDLQVRSATDAVVRTIRDEP
jgi:hypothetical protein